MARGLADRWARWIDPRSVVDAGSASFFSANTFPAMSRTVVKPRSKAFSLLFAPIRRW